MIFTALKLIRADFGYTTLDHARLDFKFRSIHQPMFVITFSLQDKVGVPCNFIFTGAVMIVKGPSTQSMESNFLQRYDVVSSCLSRFTVY